ncbi:MAG: efflux RND transporter permease subunit, partial [Acidobacteriota bacterium]
IKGVAAVRVRGGLEEEIHVLLDEEQLRRTGLSIREVIERVGQENVNLAGGTIKDGRVEYMVRTVGEFDDIGEIRETVVSLIDGREVRVRDLGSVVARHKERQVLTRTDGATSVQIEIYKEADANIVALAKRVRAAVGAVPVSDSSTVKSQTAEGRRTAGLAERLFEDEGATLRIVADRSVFIEGSIQEVRNTAVLGGLLATFVLFLFLRNVRTTLIVAISIPISLLITFAPLNLLGVTLNVMSLGGLALGIGMLVDSSIVVLESIHRCREEGDGIVDAAIRGTAEVRSAVMASTLTSIAVFFPMVFVQGIAGQAFGDLGLAVVISLLASAGVALLFIPMLASRAVAGLEESRGREPTSRASLARFASWQTLQNAWLGHGSTLRTLLGPYWLVRFLLHATLEMIGKVLLLLVIGIAALVYYVLRPLGTLFLRGAGWLPLKLTDLAMRALADGYPGLLRLALAHPLAVVLLVAGCLWGSWQLLGTMDSELLPEVRQGEFTVEVALPVGTPLEQTERVLAPVERAILAERDHIDSLILTLGRDATRSERSDEGEHSARFKVLLSAGTHRLVEDRVVHRLREQFESIPDLDARVTRPVLFSFKTPIEVEVYGDDLVELRRYGELVHAEMAAMRELADVKLSMKSGAPEVQISYDRARLARYGLNIGEVARLVRDKIQGTEATRYNLKDRRIPVVVRLLEEDRRSLDDVRGLVVNPGASTPIPLEAVAAVGLGEGPSEIRRVDGQRVALVSANIASGSLGSVTAAIDRRLSERIDWPAGMGFSLAGQNQEWQRSRASLWLALGLSVFLVYVIMAAQFESLVHPLVIMFSIPLAFVGTLALLSWLSISLSVVVFLGMIMLAGIVVNNAIVLVDYINQLRRRGLDRHSAILTAGRVRLRPILMTTATTVLGLLPLAIGLGQGAELRTPMAIAVIGGLLSSTALTLIVVPTFYDLVDRAVAALFGQRERSRALPPEVGETEPAV